MKQIILILFFFMGQVAVLFSQKSIGLSYQYPYTNDTYVLEYFHSFKTKWSWAAGLKVLSNRKFNFNDERAFYRARYAQGFVERIGVTGSVYYKWTPETWNVRSFIGWTSQFTYAGININYSERTGVEYAPGFYEVNWYNDIYSAFPTIENHLLLRVEAPITKRLFLQLAVGGGLATSWGWDKSLEYFRFTEGFGRCCKEPVGDRKVYTEFTPTYTLGFGWSF